MSDDDSVSEADDGRNAAPKPEPDQPARIAIGSSRSPDEPAWTRLLAPLRSEGAAFRALLAVAAVCGAFAAVVVLVRALS